MVPSPLDLDRLRAALETGEAVAIDPVPLPPASPEASAPRVPRDDERAARPKKSDPRPDPEPTPEDRRSAAPQPPPDPARGRGRAHSAAGTQVCSPDPRLASLLRGTCSAGSAPSASPLGPLGPLGPPGSEKAPSAEAPWLDRHRLLDRIDWRVRVAALRARAELPLGDAEPAEPELPEPAGPSTEDRVHARARTRAAREGTRSSGPRVSVSRRTGPLHILV